MVSSARDAWQKLYAKHGLQYGGQGNIKPLEPFLRPDMLVLDAGCGDGKTTESIAKKCDVVGSDFSREALLSLRSQRQSLSNVNLVECELASMPFESEKFDAVVCVHAVSHMLRRERHEIAEELARVLKREGRILVEGFGKDDVRFGVGAKVEEGTFLRGNGILTHYFEEREIPRLFRGLELITETRVVRRTTLGSKSGKREIIRALMKKE